MLRLTRSRGTLLRCPARVGKPRCAGPRRVSLVLVVAGQERREPLDGVLERRVAVDEHPQALGQPLHADLLFAAAFGELLDPRSVAYTCSRLVVERAS